MPGGSGFDPGESAFEPLRFGVDARRVGAEPWRVSFHPRKGISEPQKLRILQGLARDRLDSTGADRESLLAPGELFKCPLNPLVVRASLRVRSAAREDCIERG